MPLHRHECDVCGNRFRVLVLPSAESESPTCPACGSESTRRLMPLVAVQFKGSGFYKTDHGHGGRSRPDKSSSDGDSHDTGASETSSGSRASDKPKGHTSSKDAAPSSPAD